MTKAYADWSRDLRSQVREMRRHRKTIVEIAAATRLSPSAVTAGIHRHRIKRTLLSECLRDKILGLCGRDITDVEIGKMVGCSQDLVTIIRRRAGLPRCGRSADGKRAYAQRTARRAQRGGWPLVRHCEIVILEALYDLGGTATATTLATHLNRYRRRIVVILRNLVVAGHVITSLDRYDRRYQIKAAVAGNHEAAINSCSQPSPAFACPYPPGSEGKIACLERRRAERVGLWHPGDYLPCVADCLHHFLEGLCLQADIMSGTLDDEV